MQEVKHHHDDCDCEECQKEYDGDGLDNKEHLIDMFEQADMLYDNIKDNTDSAFSLLKSMEGQDEDILDVVRINSSQILDTEKQTKDIYEKIKVIEISLKDNLEQISDGKIKMLNEYLEVLEKCEQTSNDLFERLIGIIK